jgi:hypothetical protein
VRGALALLLMGLTVSGFSEPDEGLAPGTSVAGTPTVGITGAGPASGSGIGGEVVAIDPVQNPPVVLLSTTAGQMYILLTDPAMLSRLSLGQLVVFSGQFLAVDLFSAAFVGDPATVADGMDELSLGSALGSSSPLVLAPPLGSDQTSPPSNGSGSSIQSSSNKSNNNSGDNSDNASSGSSDCSSGQTLALDPENGSASAGTTFKVTVTANDASDCEGKSVYLQVLDGPNLSMTPVSENLDSDNRATLSYSSDVGGKDSYRVWLDYVPNGTFDDGEPTVLGTVKWSGPTATPTSPAPAAPIGTATATVTDAILATPTATATITATSTPTGTATPTPTSTVSTRAAPATPTRTPTRTSSPTPTVTPGGAAPPKRR